MVGPELAQQKTGTIKLSETITGRGKKQGSGVSETPELQIELSNPVRRVCAGWLPSALINFMARPSHF